MNTEGLPLFLRHVPHNRTETSVDAALSIRSELPRLEGFVLWFLKGRPDGATAQEIEVALQMAGNTVRPRLVGLRERGKIEDSGLRRETQSGRRAVVWRVASGVPGTRAEGDKSGTW